MRKDAALQIIAKGLADMGLGRVVVALAVELACAGEFMPDLKVFGYRCLFKLCLMQGGLMAAPIFAYSVAAMPLLLNRQLHTF